VSDRVSYREARQLLAKSKPSKYRAKITEVDGIIFASRREARRWSVLRQLERAGEISGLRRQVSFPLHALGGAKVTSYRADFQYTDKTGAMVVEDAKGVVTELFRIKKKWLAAEYRIDIVEV
jgi:Protein of unknown function (DUF1064)